MRSAPTTALGQHKMIAFLGFAPTIKFVYVMDNGLHHSPVMVSLGEKAKLFRLPLIVLENNSDWEKDNWLDNREHAKAPTPSRPCHDCGGEKRARKGSADEWGACKSKSESPVLQSRGIRDKDVEDEVKGAVPNKKQYVSGCVAVRAT
jgi:hypothetical protein